MVPITLRYRRYCCPFFYASSILMPRSFWYWLYCCFPAVSIVLPPLYRNPLYRLYHCPYILILLKYSRYLLHNCSYIPGTTYISAPLFQMSPILFPLYSRYGLYCNPYIPETTYGIAPIFQLLPILLLFYFKYQLYYCPYIPGTPYTIAPIFQILPILLSLIILLSLAYISGIAYILPL